MKNLVYLILIVFNFNGCLAQKKTEMENQEIIPKITEKFEKFDIEKFQSTNKSKVVEISNDIQITYTGDKKNSEIKSGFSKTMYYTNSVFHIVKNYYSNGKIEIKGVRFNNGSEYGIWYEFNEEGKLTKEIDTDEGYSFGWDKIIGYCEKNNIILEKGVPKNGGVKTEIYKNEEGGKKVWAITYYNYKKGEYLALTIDGSTGELIKEQVIELEGS